MHQTIRKGYDVHRSARNSEAPQSPPIAQRLLAAMALLMTPAISYALGALAWAQAQPLISGGRGLALLGSPTLTLGQVVSPLAATAGALIAAHLTWTTLVMLITPRSSR